MQVKTTECSVKLASIQDEELTGKLLRHVSTYMTLNFLFFSTSVTEVKCQICVNILNMIKAAYKLKTNI